MADAGFQRTIRIVVRSLRGVVDARGSRAPALARQHFLKRDAVFLSALVYSGCSAFRFPSARTTKSSTQSEGNMAKKAKKAKKAKSAVKKTAKKTRKVAKKKK